MARITRTQGDPSSLDSRNLRWTPGGHQSRSSASPAGRLSESPRAASGRPHSLRTVVSGPAKDHNWLGPDPPDISAEPEESVNRPSCFPRDPRPGGGRLPLRLRIRTRLQSHAPDTRTPLPRPLPDVFQAPLRDQQGRLRHRSPPRLVAQRRGPLLQPRLQRLLRRRALLSRACRLHGAVRESTATRR